MSSRQEAIEDDLNKDYILFCRLFVVKAARACQQDQVELLTGLQRGAEVCALCTSKEGFHYQYVNALALCVPLMVTIASLQSSNLKKTLQVL